MGVFRCVILRACSSVSPTPSVGGTPGGERFFVLRPVDFMLRLIPVDDRNRIGIVGFGFPQRFHQLSAGGRNETVFSREVESVLQTELI